MSPLRRRTPLARSPMKRGKRKPSEFARIYGSKERVAWVKALPCIICTNRPCENAHTESGGMARKAGYATIVPLCRIHHRMYDERVWPFGEESQRAWIRELANRVEEVWQAYTVHQRNARA